MPKGYYIDDAMFAQVKKLVAKGYRSRDIAKILDISDTTVSRIKHSASLDDYIERQRSSVRYYPKGKTALNWPLPGDVGKIVPPSPSDTTKLVEELHQLNAQFGRLLELLEQATGVDA